MLQSNFSHLDGIDPRFLDADASFVVMLESVELNLSEAHSALDALSWILEGMVNQNAALKSADKSQVLVEMPPDSMAALMRIIREKIEPAINNPTLSAVRSLRPDVFNRNAKGAI